VCCVPRGGTQGGVDANRVIGAPGGGPAGGDREKLRGWGAAEGWAALDFGVRRRHGFGMRFPLVFAMMGGLVPVMALADDTSVPMLMAEAQKDFVAQDYDGAKELFNEVLQLDPQNQQAIQFLRVIRVKQKGLPGDPKDNPVNDLIIPKIEFKDATINAALTFLKQKAADQKVDVSFVTELPPALMARTFSLSLSHIPFLDALEYICEQNSAIYKVERYAIVITPLPSVGTPAPAQ
jgi:hypothetical protein